MPAMQTPRIADSIMQAYQFRIRLAPMAASEELAYRLEGPVMAGVGHSLAAIGTPCVPVSRPMYSS